MATATTIQLPDSWPSLAPYPQALPSGSSRTASRLLQENNELHHMFFNGIGFHNHIAHALLTLWALGASSAHLETAWELNKVFQRPQLPMDEAIVRGLPDDGTFMRCMGNETYYTAFLKFFQNEIAASGWQEVLQKYIFAADERADAMLVRLFDSFLHPVIHLGFGVEFGQPAIIAEALAQTACHQDWIGDLLLPAEAAAKAGSASNCIVGVLDAMRGDETILQAPRWEDDDKIRDGMLGRAGDRMIHYLSQVKVLPDELPAKTAEMINTAAYLTAGAQRADKAVKFDFYLLHCLTSSMFFSTFLEQSWLSNSNKARLLEWKIRMDLVMYTSRKSPAIHIEIIRDYQPRRPSDWNDIRERICLVPDDGHASKLFRAVAHGYEICKPYSHNDAFRLKDDDWHQLALMAIDSIETDGQNDNPKIQFDGPSDAWVRSAGFDEAWLDVPGSGHPCKS